MTSAGDPLQEALERHALIEELLRDALTLEPQAVWQRMAKALIGRFGCERATIFQRDAKGRLVSLYAHGLDKPLRLGRGAGIAGSVAETGLPRVVNAAYEDPGFNAAVDQVTGFKTTNLIAYPIRHQRRTAGVIELINKRGGFEPGDLAALEQLSSHLAVIFVQFTLEERHQEMARQMSQVEKMAAIGRLAAGMAHEINNPLCSILGFAHLLLNSAETAPDAIKDLLKIDAEARRIQSIVRNVLTFSRLSPDQLCEVGVAGVAEASLDLVGHELRRRKAKLRKELAPDTPAILGDSNSLKQVFINLILNALQAMDAQGGGTLLVKVLASADRETVIAEVADTGPGIPEEALDKIFEPFFTTKAAEKGTGLGLYVTQGIVERHQGRIEVETAIGKGTTFRLLFPALEAAAREDAARRLEAGGEPEPV